MFNIHSCFSDWLLDSSRYVLLSTIYALITPSIKSTTVPHLLNLRTKTSTQITNPYVVLDDLRLLSPTSVLFVGTSHSAPSALTTLTLPASYSVEKPEDVVFQTIKASSKVDEKVVPVGMFSQGKGLEFDVPGEGKDKGKMVNLNVVFYPPKHSGYAGGDDGEKPPVVVSAHGGPTSQSLPGHSWRIQYYTSRGYAFLDVNYGGSSGYGREYMSVYTPSGQRIMADWCACICLIRKRLQGNWGIVDVSDTIEAVKHCSKEGLVDGKRVAIIGGSAGGYTVLSALTKSDVFAVGVSSYGIGDLKLLADGTHKFESQYLFKLGVFVC